MSRREDILTALLAQIRDTFAADAALSRAEVMRGEVLPVEIPAYGLVILRDGTPGEPEVLMSPLLYCYQHRAEVELLMQAGADRDQYLDQLASGLGQAVAADRTLGGLCDWIEAEAPVVTDLPVEGAETMKGATVAVVLHYCIADPLI